MVLSQALPSSAREYARTQRAQSREAVTAVLRQWRRMGVADFDASYSLIEPTLLAVVQQAQAQVAAGAQDYIPDVLEETGQARAIATTAQADTSRLIGVAGDGRSLDGLLYGAVTHAKQQVTKRPVYDDELNRIVGWLAPMTPAQALRSSSSWLSMAVGTVLSDTARQSESLGMAIRPRVTGYVRMLSAPSCSRCVILAGRWYRSGTAFQRHPRCDCRHIPAAEGLADDLTVNPAEYVDSLTAQQQDALLGKAGAEAVRTGADLNQVVNARRGMRSAQIGGRDVLITSEGTTRRGVAYRSLAAKRPRLMPETIAQVATGHDDYLRLLRVNGYLR